MKHRQVPDHHPQGDFENNPTDKAASPPVTTEIAPSQQQALVPYPEHTSWLRRLFRRKSIYERPLPDYHPFQRLQRILRNTQHFPR
ncbi:MAG: hypothetical protein QGG39_07645 [Candidatus Poribacteria bacterium]|jgi:hypothetical protein|nr:hypothetical protein [Candidatus Poribacteria bacterium]